LCLSFRLFCSLVPKFFARANGAQQLARVERPFLILT
jgi:hypothetical protein